MKVCQKINCFEPVIKRGKYCVAHCTVKRLRQPEISEDEVLRQLQDEIRNSRQLEEEQRRNEELRREQYQTDRLLREEQEIEFEETRLRDMERITIESENELKILKEKLDKELELRDKRLRVQCLENREDEKYYKIKFVFPNNQGLSIISNFCKDSYFSNLFDFIDVFLNDVSISMGEYTIISYPNKSFEKVIDDDRKLVDFSRSKNIQFM